MCQTLSQYTHTHTIRWKKNRKLKSGVRDQGPLNMTIICICIDSPMTIIIPIIYTIHVGRKWTILLNEIMLEMIQTKRKRKRKLHIKYNE